MEEILGYANRYDKVQNVMFLVSEKALKQAYQSLPDTNIKVSYGSNNFDAHIHRLLCRMKKFSFFPEMELGEGESLEHEFRQLETQIVECVFAKILRLLYGVKSSVIFSPKCGKIQVQNVGTRPQLFPYLWKVEICVLNKSIDQKKLTDFLGQYIADRRFMKYLGRFLKSGVMENLIQSDAEWVSDKTLASILMHIYCYHILREWLCSKGDSLRKNVYLRYHRGYFCFHAWSMEDLSEICNGLVDDQDKTGLQIVRNTYIEYLFDKRLNSRFTSKNRRKNGGRKFETNK